MSASDPVHTLQTFLQLQLASDNTAVLNLPYLIQFLSPQHLQPSPHLQKWVTRINSLIHSKDPGARWAGLSVACRTSILSRELMLENARSWVSAALPLFSVRVSIHTLFSWISPCERNKSPCRLSKPPYDSSLIYSLLQSIHQSFSGKLHPQMSRSLALHSSPLLRITQAVN